MQLFKMLGQVFELETETNIVPVKSNSVNQYNKEELNNNSEINNNGYTKKEYSHNKPQVGGTNKHSSFYCLFAPDGESLLVLDNKEQIKIKLYDISHPDKYHQQAKKSSNLLNDLAKKKKVYYDVFDNNGKKEYKIYLDVLKEKCVNDFLIESGLQSSVQVNQLKNDNKEKIKEQYTPAKVITKGNDNQGIVLRFGSEPYLFKDGNSLSYFIELKNENKSTVFWGVDLERVILENNISQGDEISVKNLGPQMVNVKLPIKDKFGNVTGHEEKNVKRNTWDAIIINRSKEIQVSKEHSEIKNPIVLQSKNENISEENVNKEEKRKNCYALFATGANTFSCMYQGKNNEFTLADIDLSSLSNKQQENIESKLNELITKKVVYIEFKGNNIVKLYKDKTTLISINKELLNIQLEPTLIKDYNLQEKNDNIIPVHIPVTQELTQFKKIVTENENIEKIINNSNESLKKAYAVDLDDPFSDAFYEDTPTIISNQLDNVKESVENSNIVSNISPEVINDFSHDIPEHFNSSSSDYFDSNIPFEIDNLPPIDIEGMNLDDIPFDDNDFFNSIPDNDDSQISITQSIEENIIEKIEILNDKVEDVQPKKLAFGKMKR